MMEINVFIRIVHYNVEQSRIDTIQCQESILGDVFGDQEPYIVG